MDTKADHLADQELVRAVLAGDPGAVTDLVQRLRCIPRILAALNRRRGGLLGAEDLDDLTQDTLALLWPRMESYTGQASLETWFYGFCFNGFMNAVRKERRRQGVDSLEERAVAGHADPPPVSEHDDVHRGLEQLDEREARAIRLKYFDQLTFEEIGVRLDISPNTAKTIYYRGMRRLEQLLRRGSGEVGP